MNGPNAKLWLNISKLKLGNIQAIFPSFQNRAWCENIWRIITQYISSMRCENILGYLFLDIGNSVFLKLCSWKTVRFSEQVMCRQISEHINFQGAYPQCHLICTPLPTFTVTQILPTASVVFPNVVPLAASQTRGLFLESPGNLTDPKRYFEIKVSRKVGRVLTFNEFHFVSFPDSVTV